MKYLGRGRRREKSKMNSSIKVANTAAKAAYINLIRAVRKHVGSEDHKSHFTDFIKNEFSKNVSSQNPKNLKLAEDYTFYLNSVHHQKELLFSYNIAVDRSDEMKKVLGKSAASVGLQLPDVYRS